jgi:hypothetical protein
MLTTMLAVALAAAPIRHPLQPPLECRVDTSEYVKADVYYVPDGGAEKKLGDTYGTFNPEGTCELAARNSRNGVLCVNKASTVTAVSIATGASVGTYGSESESAYRACFRAVNKDQLAVRPGHALDFIDPARLAPFKAALPKVDDAAVQAVLNDPDTMWYDELSMIFTYQDSQGDPRGLRANRVGYDVGVNTPDVPDIHELVNYFEPNHFKAPFKSAFGTAAVDERDVYLLNFWHLPTANGAAIPVKYWQHGGDGDSRWRWTFPIGTVFGEVMMVRAPDDGSWHPFEIRTRKRYAAGWSVNAFRPFLKAGDLAAAIRAARPTTSGAGDLAVLIAHLTSGAGLERHTLAAAPVYAAAVPAISGALDYLPETRDYALIKELLQTTTFKSAEGSVWSEGDGLETYAPSTRAAFSIVPQGYEGGVMAVNEDNCNRCHDQTGRMLGDLDGRVVLYGEIWGEDRIFTWHLFDAGFDAFTVSDGSRRINPRLVQAKLVESGRPAAGDARYGTPLEPVIH